MKRASLPAARILEEIEFELAQGQVRLGELGQRLQAVRRFQNQQRGELMTAATRDPADALSRQMQLNDMLMTLMQGMVAEIEAMRLSLHRTAAQVPLDEGTAASPAVAPAPDPLARDDLPWRPTRELHEAMHPEALEVTMEARPVGLPVVGALAQRARLALHDLSLFYLRRLAGKQGAVNRTYGEWFLHLNDIHQAQQAQIEALTAQVAALQGRLDERAGD